MKIILKNIEQYLDLGRTCFLLNYELNGSNITLEYCIGYYFKI